MSTASSVSVENLPYPIKRKSQRKWLILRRGCNRKRIRVSHSALGPVSSTFLGAGNWCILQAACGTLPKRAGVTHPVRPEEGRPKPDLIGHLRVLLFGSAQRADGISTMKRFCPPASLERCPRSPGKLVGRTTRDLIQCVTTRIGSLQWETAMQRVHRCQSLGNWNEGAA
jgi:hypothetical protein